MAAQRLKRGDTAYKNVGLAESVARLWETELAEHFDHEERFVFPLATTPELSTMIDRARDEHRRIRALVDRIRDGVDASANARLLGELLHAHIRFEERELFERMQAEVDGEMLAAAGRVMEGERTARVCSNDTPGH